MFHPQLIQRVALLQEVGEVNLRLAEIDAEIGRHAVRQRRRRWWVRPWILRRPQLGQYETMMGELQLEDEAALKNFLRIDQELFQELLVRLDHVLQKNTRYRQPLEPGLKLAITLRHLATGDSYKSLMYSFRVAYNTISLFVPEVCDAIVAVYGEEVISCPTTPDEWRAVAKKFQDRWQFPHTLGALDGKHIAIRCPKNGGSLYYNYKGFHSIILMALVDADYKFLWVDLGANGSASDCQVFNHGELKEAIEDGSIGFPEADEMPYDDWPMNYFIVGDDAFPLRPWLMKPYSRRNLENDERIFNYRLSRARRVVENAFGILANRWRCLLRTMGQQPHIVEKIIVACICLHNMMRTRHPGPLHELVDQDDRNHRVVRGGWRNDMNLHNLQVVGGNVTTREAKRQRLYLTDYFNSAAGSVPWQQNMI